MYESMVVWSVGWIRPLCPYQFIPIELAVSHMDCDHRGPSHFCPIVVIPFHSALVVVEILATDTLHQTQTEFWEGGKKGGGGGKKGVGGGKKGGGGGREGRREGGRERKSVGVKEILLDQYNEARYPAHVLSAHSKPSTVLCSRGNDQLHTVLYYATSLSRLRLHVAQ